MTASNRFNISSTSTVLVRLPTALILAGALVAPTFAQEDDSAFMDVSKPPTVERQTETTSTPTTTSAPQKNTTGQEPQSNIANAEPATEQDSQSTAQGSRFFGTTKITEHKRENGQVYSIELEHSSGSKQYIEDTDSDGLADSRTKDIDDNPNIAKWRIGSW